MSDRLIIEAPATPSTFTPRAPTTPQAPRGSPAPSPISSTPAATLNKVKKKKDAQQATIAGIGSVIPVIYGYVRIGARVGAVISVNGDLFLLCVWCVGEIEEIESYTINDEAPGAGVSATHYTGTQTQAADPWLVLAYAAKGITYNDALPGIAYSVVRVARSRNAGFPAVAAIVKGRKVALTDGGTPTYSTNPAYCMADFITSSQYYGMGKAVDWTSLATVAAACDATVGTSSEKRHTLNLALDSVQDDVTWLNVLRDYAGCFAVPDGDVYRFVLDATGSSVKSFDATNIVAKTFKWKKRGLKDTPTVVGVTYTDTTQTPWADDTVPVYGVGVLEGATPYRYSGVQKAGLVTYSEANRYGVERLNDATLCDLSIGFDAFDEALAVQIGDLIDVTFSAFTAKLFRVTALAAPSPGRWSISAIEYDPAKYSDAVVDGPSVVDTSLPDPASPPAVTGVAATEELYQEQTGRWASRFRITWDEPADFPFVANYIVSIVQAGAVVQGPTTAPGSSAEFVTAALKQDLLYTLQVQILSTSAALGDAGSISLTSLGKSALPSDVPSITGYEIGGEVRLTWEAATDLDLTAYEIRYGAVGVTWASAALLDRVSTPSVRYATREIASGTYDILIKALDSVHTDAFPFGQESADEARCTVDVTSDSNAFVAGDVAFASPLLFNMSGGGPWLTDMGDTWSSLFGSAMSTYTNPLNTYHTAGTSAIVTEVADLGASLTGDFFVGMDYEDISGTAAQFIETNDAGAESSKTITGATNATPIVLAIASHGYSTGDEIDVASVGGNTAANGKRLVTVVDSGHVSLQDLMGNNVAGNGTYTSGGTASRWVWSRYQATTVKATARYARSRIVTTGTMEVTSLGAVRVNVVARSEGGIVTTLSSGAKIVTLANRYNKAVSIIATALKSASPLHCVYDNVEVDGARGVGAGQALLFNGTSDYVDVSDSSPLRLSTALTLTAQVRIASITGATQGIARKDTETGTRYMWGLQVGISGRIEAVYVNGNAGSPFIARSLQPPALDRWMFLAMVISGTSLSLYVDNVLQQTVTIAGTQSYPTGRMSIGSNAPNVVTGASHLEYFGGRIDDVRVWNVARSAADLMSDYNSPLTGSESGLVGYWKFDSLTGTTATDSTSNANNGTVSGAKWRPLNGFDLYTFDSSDAQQAGEASYQFSGV